jgi:hypothetical protein
MEAFEQTIRERKAAGNISYTVAAAAKLWRIKDLIYIYLNIKIN